MKHGRYDELTAALRRFIPAARLVREPLRMLAYATDASFYRLIPRLVVIVENEDEVAGVLREARRRGIAVTFRAAGTSLSGQAITDSVLIKLGPGWRGYRIGDGAQTIRLQPGVIGGHANRYLAPFGKKIGPDPASIDAAQIGGIAANNASGMCCGTAQNSYQTLQSMRLLLADGSTLDTGDPQSRQLFLIERADLVQELKRLIARVRGDRTLVERIRHKYRLKNTTGYSLNALIDFDDPIDVIQHLMIGSEGTLGFIAEITYRTVDDYPHKASALLLFADIEAACRAVARLKQTPVAAVELMDRAALRAVEDKPGMPDVLHGLGDEAAALLVETRGADAQELVLHTTTIGAALEGAAMLQPVRFTDVAAQYERLWKIRKGLFPAVGAMRETGTTVIIEDVAFPVPQLAAAVRDLRELLERYRYHEAIIFGHALEGNLHFVFTQDFSRADEVRRYGNFMDEVCRLVVERYDGSLKAEHGTGRNMAPYVELEWGSEAYALMKAIKTLFDPEGLLNPGVLLNDNREVHLQNLKPLPAADPRIDSCIECGFCEPHCPSRHLTLTPRQRIAGWREISRLQQDERHAMLLQRLVGAYQYDGLDTCAACGLCATACPVGINTGDLTRQLRHRNSARWERRAHWIGRHLSGVTQAARLGLGAVDVAHAVLGPTAMEALSGGLRKLSGNRLPRWHRYVPKPARSLPTQADGVEQAPCVVYFPSCGARTLGAARGDVESASLADKNLALLRKAGYRVVIPEGVAGLCCGMAFHSKGQFAEAERKSQELKQTLMAASNDGEYPVYCDTSPCLLHMKERYGDALQLHDPVEFIHRFLLDRLALEPLDETVALHITCSTRKMGLDAQLIAIARRCTREVVIPDQVGCCGFAGDRGFTVPELNAAALRDLKAALPQGVTSGYSTSRTCEIGLSLHSGVHYRSIVYLVDRCARAATDD